MSKPRELTDVIDRLCEVVPGLTPIFAEQRKILLDLAYVAPENRLGSERICWAIAQGTLYGAMHVWAELGTVTLEQVEATKKIWST